MRIPCMVTITESEFVYLPGDSWWWRHDAVKLCIVNICNDSKIRADAEVFGLFRDLIPPEVFQRRRRTPVWATASGTHPRPSPQNPNPRWCD